MRPPQFWAWLLARVLPDDVPGRSIRGDLVQEFVERAALNAGGARWWYRREAASIVARAVVARRDVGIGRNDGRRGDPVWSDLLADARHALHGLARTPRFTIITALTLALGIGTATTVFSVVNGVVLEPLDLPEPDALVNIGSTAPGLGYDRFPVSPDIYFWYREHSRSFTGMGLYQGTQATLTADGGEPERVAAALVSHTLLGALGVEPALGRAFLPEEDVPDAPRVAMLSWDLWQRRYGGDRSIIDRTLTVNGEPTVVVGVLPADFDFLSDPDAGQEGNRGMDLWLPARLNAENPIQGNFGWNAVGRLRAGITPEAAQAELAPLIPRMVEDLGVSDNYGAFIANGRYAPVVARMKDDLVGGIERPLWILMGTVVVVLLIACANVANLFLIRAEGRQRDTAVQAALGASRRLLIRKQLVESVVLAAIGGGAGLLLAAAGTPALVRAAPPGLPRLDNVSVDGTVALFAIAASFAAALFFGVAPAFRYTRPGILTTLRHGGRGATVGRARHRLRGLLVVTQTALALVLLVGSGLLVRSLRQALAMDPGFETTADILTFRVSLPPARYPTLDDQTLFHLQLLERLRALPGVESAGATSVLPLVAAAPGTAHSIEGLPLEPGQLPPMLHFKVVTDGYMETLGLRLAEGRTLTTVDRGQDNIVIGRNVADRLWPGENALGRRLRVTGDTAGWFTVIGIVETVRQQGFREEPQPLIYYPADAGRSPTDAASLSYAIRTRTGTAMTAAVRQAIRDLDPDLPIAAVRTMDDIAAESVITLSFTVLALGIAAGFALLLGAIGLYGVLAYAVSMRTREIGVRMALGAERTRVMRMVIAEGTRLAAIGLVIGIAGAIAATRLLRGVLFGVEPLDPPTFAVTAAIFAAVAVFASWLPARKAASVEPMVSLQNE